MKKTFTLKVNWIKRSVEAAADTPLLWVLRDGLNLTGTKYGCGIGACGACTIHQNGKTLRSCQIAVADAADGQAPAAAAVRINLVLPEENHR